MNENDSMSDHNEIDILDKVVPAMDKILIESAWIYPYEEPAKPKNRKPPDPPAAESTENESPDFPPDTKVNCVSLQYKLNL